MLIRVVFMDAGTGAEIGRADLPADLVPQGFDAQTTVQLGDSAWVVEDAERHEGGTLTLSVRQVEMAEMVQTRSILYSLPTICDLLPLTEDAWGSDRLEVHEDDWRQIEFVDGLLADVVAEQLEAIEHVHGGRVDEGFREIHVRSEPADPLPGGISKRALLSLLDAVEDGRGVGFEGQAGVVPGSFTVTAGSLVLYGVAHGDTVKVLGLVEHGPLPEGLLGSFNLLLVDWVRRIVERG